MNRQLAGWVTHHWPSGSCSSSPLIIIGSMGFLGVKLTSVQKNEISAWLPGDAESTQVIEESRAFADPEAIPAVVLYERESGITRADAAKAAADARTFADIDKVSGDVIGPDRVEGRQGPPDRRHVRHRLRRLGRFFPISVDELREDRRRLERARREHRRPCRVRRRPGGGVRGRRRHPAARRLGDRLRDPADHLPQPPARGAVPALRCRRGAHGARCRLPAGEVRRPHRQRPERQHPQRARPGSRGRLRPPPRGPLPRGAAQLRGPARGDGPRPAPRRARDPGQRRHGDRRTAVPHVRPDELHQRPRSGGSSRHRLRPPRHDGPAAGAAGDRRTLDLLAVHPPLRRSDLDRDTGSGPGSGSASRVVPVPCGSPPR